MRRKGQKAALITVLVAGAMVIALLIAGTALRMRTDGLNFGQALRAFAADTFLPRRGNP